jgi:malate synthase
MNKLKPGSATHISEILTPSALEFLEKLHKHFNSKRLELLKHRDERQLRIHKGEKPDFLEGTKNIRDDSSWKVAQTPSDIQKRWVEITGPTDRKMVINAMNSGANVFMADFEDSNSPTWNNIIEGQINLCDAVDGTISFEGPEGKKYTLNNQTAVLFVRPRGWHLNEKNIIINGKQISGSLFDFGLFFFHNAKKLIKKGSAPYFYLPKMESHLEARLWNEVFVFSQNELGVPQGSIRATVLIETIFAAFEMDEILYELKDHSAGLNAGRWDYIFSIIKKFRRQESLSFPDRDQVVMTTPFMRSYTGLIVHTCHKRGAHAMGGMAAFIPNKSDPEVTEKALKKVQEDKTREVQDGFDGTWVAHPALVSIAHDIFAQGLKNQPNQKQVMRDDVKVTAKQLLDFVVPNGKITEKGLRHNINVALQYLTSWLSGKGAAAIFNLMEDAATAEISRAQVWQWIVSKSTLEDGTVIDKKLVERLINEEEKKIKQQQGNQFEDGHFVKAKTLFENLVFSEHFHEFLTIPAYEFLD